MTDRSAVPSIDSPTTSAAPYRRWAVVMLVVTVALGAWMRAMMVWPGAIPRGLTFPHLVHAHSHVAFFGWLVLALAATYARGATRAGAHRTLAHAIGIGSLLALVAFALQGYSPLAIALSAVHVALWLVFVALVWPLRDVPAPARPWRRAALVGLVAAGMSTLLPGILRARGVESGWLREVGIESFLNCFIFGWVVLGSIGLLYERAGRSRWSGTALALVATGLLPSTLLYVTTPAPAAWPLIVGRGGALLVGAGLLLASIDLMKARARASALPLLAFALVGALELNAGAGLGATLLHSRPIVLAFVHLVLLGVATPVLLGEWVAAQRRLSIGALYAGLATMLAALVVMGWPRLLARAAAAHVQYATLFAAAFWGGIVVVAACLAILLDHHLGAAHHAESRAAASLLESTAP